MVVSNAIQVNMVNASGRVIAGAIASALHAHEIMDKGTRVIVCTPLAGQRQRKRRPPQGVCIIPRFDAGDFPQKKAHVSRIVYSCKTALNYS